MLNILLLTVGPLPRGPFQEIGDNFARQLKKYARITVRSYDTHDSLLKKAPDGAILLDAEGVAYSSVAFARFLGTFEDRGETLTCILGGPDGFRAEEKKRFIMLSLSPLTTTHDLAHLFLLEQLYRGMSIVHGSPYHRV